MGKQQNGKKTVAGARICLYCPLCPSSWLYADRQHMQRVCKYCSSDWCVDSGQPQLSAPSKGKGKGKKGIGQEAKGKGKGKANGQPRTVGDFLPPRQVFMPQPPAANMWAGSPEDVDGDCDPISAYVDSLPGLDTVLRHRLAFALTLDSEQRTYLLEGQPRMQKLADHFLEKQKALLVPPTLTQMYYAAKKDFTTFKKQVGINTDQTAKYKGLVLSIQQSLEDAKARVANLEEEKKELDLKLLQAEERMASAFNAQPLQSDNVGKPNPPGAKVLDEEGIRDVVQSIVASRLGAAGESTQNAVDHILEHLAKVFADQKTTSPTPAEAAAATAPSRRQREQEPAEMEVTAETQSLELRQVRRRDELEGLESRAKHFKSQFRDAPLHCLADLPTEPVAGTSSSSKPEVPSDANTGTLCP
jgi:hypothetical protein